MYMRHTNFLFLALLCFLNNCTLFGSDPAHDVLFNNDHVQHIFENGTEKSNEELRCSCKALNTAGALYHAKKACIVNEKYKDVDYLKAFGFMAVPVPSIIIFPGGKLCSVLQYDSGFKNPNRSTYGLLSFLKQDFEPLTNSFNHGTLSDPQRKYCIGLVFPDKTPNVHDKVNLSLILPTKRYKLYEIPIDFRSYYSENTYIIGAHIGIDKYDISFLFCANQLMATTYKEECQMAGKTLCYELLKRSRTGEVQHLDDEYEVDCWEGIDEGRTQVPEVPLEIIKTKTIKKYRLKNDSLLQNEQMQWYLYELLSASSYGLAQSIDLYTADDIAGFYITALLWTGDNWFAKESLSVLCNKEIETRRYQEKTRLGKITGILSSWVKNPLSIPRRNPILDDATIDNWNTELSQTIKHHKQQGEKSFVVYLNEVKKFVTHECREWEEVAHQQ